MTRGRKPLKNSPQVEPRALVKKPYAVPSLVAYGSVAKLTANGNGTGIDKNAKMVCL